MFHGITLLATSFFSTLLLNKSGAAFLRVGIVLLHNKFLALTVGVGVVLIETGVISGFRDGTAFAVCVTLGVAVTV